jgi:anhydro-N-acetylmuramic acid kinase
MIKYKVIGIMSGTSLDGLDIAYCEFVKNRKWKFKIVHAETIKYSKDWKTKLGEAIKLKKNNIDSLNIEYGNYIGKEVLKFMNRKKKYPDFISSHGHTVFHQPEKGITLQIGDGKIISSICKLQVVNDFRSGDVALGGQGAPLVPIVDKILFSEYEFCLNLGGIANISFDNPKEERIAYDICPVNLVLNDLATLLGKELDSEGRFASKGKLNESLLEKLNALPFYKTKSPKSLGREWVENKFIPVLFTFNIPVQDKLRTAVEHIAIQITNAVNSPFTIRNSSLLVTGGGTYNKFLVERIAFHSKCKIIIPDDKTIQFKEAMAFAFLGTLKMRGEINILKSVTGAKRNSSGGRIYFPI